MQPGHLTKPPTDKEISQIIDLLEKRGALMNLEAINGFFTALHCAPDLVMPSQYLNDILGDQADDTNVFDGQDEAQKFFSLIINHWNHVGSQLRENDVFLPLLLEDDNGIVNGNDWAKGFLQAIEHDRDGWQVFLDDEDHAGAIVPIFALAHEHSPDPELRPYAEPITEQRREQLIIAMAAGTMQIYRYFQNHREFSAHETAHTRTYRRKTEKVGRNEPCPCGSGKKYKKCCGNQMLH